MQVVSLGFRTDLALLRLGGSLIDDRGDHQVISTPHNPTFWWGNFVLLQRPPTESVTWLDVFATEFPRATHRAFGVDGTAGTRDDVRCLTDHGLAFDASVVLTAQAVHAPARSASTAQYRPLTTDDDWAQSVEVRMRCDTEFEPQAHHAFVTAKAATNRRLVEDGHGAWFGAFVDGRLAAQLGLVSAGDGLARFQTVETDPPYRRRGLASGLVHTASQYGLDELGAQTLVMAADPEYFAIDLYRALGFTVSETQLKVEQAPR